VLVALGAAPLVRRPRISAVLQRDPHYPPVVATDGSYPPPPNWFGLLGSVVLPLFCAAALIFVVPALPSAWRGYRDEGLRGTLTVTDEKCGKGGCDYVGNFVSENGQRRLTGVLLQGGTYEVGERVPTLFTGRKGEVYAVGDHSTLFIGGFGALAASLYLIGWTAWLLDKVRRRRDGHPSATNSSHG
jgi:hypothetical protein